MLPDSDQKRNRNLWSRSWQGPGPEGAQGKDEKSSTQATAHNTDGDITVYDDLGATDKELADGELEAGAYIATTTYPDLMLPYVKGRINKWAAKWKQKRKSNRRDSANNITSTCNTTEIVHRVELFALSLLLRIADSFGGCTLSDGPAYGTCVGTSG